ncbi:MAG TPA: AarF/UbiB family protein [bacterium]|nr:AarF/UbiB family protein [bacterium]HPS29906.1 AarF/UbiB family protein [bacterium]
MAAFTRLKRFSEIGTIAAKYGLTAFMPRSLLHILKLEHRSGDEKSYRDLKLEERLRLAFEELGTTYIKLGQILSLRSDIIPLAMAEEFKKLQDNVRPLPFNVIKPIIEEELDSKIEDIFSSFNEEPVAAASISQVYSGVLKETGEEVIVKVRKPGVVEKIKGDMEIIMWIADIMQKTSSYSKNIDFKGIAEEFFWTMNSELDLLIEKTNTEKFADNFNAEEWNWLSFPKMHSTLCTSRMLVMERMRGLKLSELPELESDELFDRKVIADRGSKMLLKMILNDGFFHADLHAGNIFFTENNGVSIIDCGMCGHIDRYLREKIADLFTAFVLKDFEKVANIYIEISESTALVNKADFIKDIRRLFESLPDNLSKINTAEMVQKTSVILFRYKLKIPRELTQLIKSFSMLEGLCRELDPDFELITVAQRLSKEVIAQKYSPERIAEDFFTLSVRLIDLLKTLPNNISNIFDKIESGTLQHRFLILLNISERNFISKMVTRVCSACMITGSLIASGTLSEKPYSYAIFGIFVFSTIAFLSTFRKGS